MKDLDKIAYECVVAVDTALLLTDTVEDALGSLRKKHIRHNVIYFYVVDAENHLKGVVSTRQLLLADPRRAINDIMTHAVVKIESHQTLREAMEVFAKKSFLALPVVDRENKLLGAIDLDVVMGEAIDISTERGRWDAFQMIGVTLEDGKRPPIFHSYRLRMPWLLCNVFSGLICAIISRVYENVLSSYLLLAFFIPLVLTLSEAISIQSVAQVLQFLRRPRFHWPTAVVRGLREWQVVILLALTCGSLVGALSLFWDDGELVAGALGVGIMGSVTLSALFGIVMPVALHRAKLDPRVAAGPVVLMIVDILTTTFYLGLATWWLL